jgi:hypothetical protein
MYSFAGPARLFNVWQPLSAYAIEQGQKDVRGC